MLLEGLYIPLTTPFHPDGRLNARKLASNVARYSKTPASGLIVLGPSGEPTLLSDEETREALRAAAEAAAPEKVLIAGISRDSVQATLDLAHFAAEHDYDSILVGVPSFHGVQLHQGADRPLQQWDLYGEILTYFSTLADRSPIPLILLCDDCKGMPWPATCELAHHPNIIGFYGTSIFQSEYIATTFRHLPEIRREVTVTASFGAVTKRMQKAAGAVLAPTTFISTSTLTGTASAVAEPVPVASALRIRTRMVGFQVIASDVDSLSLSLTLGASAIAPFLAACAPQACYEVFAAWKDDDQPLANEKQGRLHPPAEFLDGLSPGGLKFACDLNGYFGGPPRLPHLPPTGEQRAELQRLMQPLRN